MTGRRRRPGTAGSATGGASTSSCTVDETTPVFVISVAAQLAGMHPQTLRQYDRLGLVSPGRTAGRGRRYSARDVAMLREVQRLSQEEGVNLAGIKRILELELEIDALREQARAAGDGAGRRCGPGCAVGQPGVRRRPGGDIVAVPRGQRPRRPDAVVQRPGGLAPATAALRPGALRTR